jgi:hypothetical protein
MKTLFLTYRIWLIVLTLLTLSVAVFGTYFFVSLFKSFWASIVSVFLLLILISNILAKIGMRYLESYELYHD